MREAPQACLPPALDADENVEQTEYIRWEGADGWLRRPSREDALGQMSHERTPLSG
jgi:hypothetical protein